MPFLLLCGMGFSAFFTGLGMVGFIPMALVMLLGNGPYVSHGVVVDKATFLADAAPLLIALPIVLAVYGAIAYGLWKERPWTRAVMMAYWAVLLVVMLVVAVVGPSTIGSLISSFAAIALCGGLAALYLYGKESVVAYYAAIAAQEASRTSTDIGVAPATQAS
jgi:hypothetical protein